jgi:hypothetical protein
MVLYCILAVLIRRPKLFVGQHQGSFATNGVNPTNRLMLSDISTSEFEELAKIIQV